MPSPATVAIARREWSQHRRSFVVLGVLGGLVGGLVVAGAALTHRTVTAPERLLETTALGDAHVRIFGDLVDDVVGLPEVRESWVGGVSVARVEDHPSLEYFGIVSPIDESALFDPVVVRGRAADPGRDDEVMMTEDASQRSGFEPGDTLRLAMLTPEEVQQFDTGFGEPDGPTVELSVTGIIRVPPGVFAGSPVVGTRAFAERTAEVRLGYDVFVTLRRGDASVPSFVAGADALGQAEAAVRGVQDFPPLEVDRPRDGTEALLRSSRVLFGGLIAAVVVAALAVIAALGQAWARHHGVGAHTQRIESALGLPTGGRVAARTLPAAGSALIAGFVAASVGVAGSALEPVGSLGRSEPQRGFRVDTGIVVAGALAVAVVMVAVAALTALRAGRRPVGDGSAAVGRLPRRLLPRRGGWAFAGATFALSSGGTRRHVPVKVALVGGVVGVAGIVGSATFAASLDRLTSTPARYGWNADFQIADITDEIAADVVADPRLSEVADVVSSSITVAGRSESAFEIERIRGDAGWVMWEGRVPTTADEIAIGPRLAERLGVEIGDDVPIEDRTMRVVGIGLGPLVNNEGLGMSVLLGPGGMRMLSDVNPFREALVTVAPGEDRDEVIESYRRYELTVRTLPEEVRNVAELGSLPAVLGLFLALLAAIALVHALFVTTRQRAKDLAVMRAIGATPRHAGLTVVAMAVSTAGVGFVFGVPLGVALARLLWGEIAASIGVRGDVAVPLTTVLELAVALAAAVLIAIVPARRAGRLDPGQELRSS